MAGIYIPGMEIPEEHGAHKIRLFVREDGTASIWGLEEYIPHEPLEVIPVPDHGRLGDLDELKTAATRRLYASNHGSMAEAYYAAIIDLIDSAADVFPADKEGDHGEKV